MYKVTSDRVFLNEEQNEGAFFNTEESVAQYIIDNAEAYEEYNDMIDECYGDVEIMGMHYCASTELERLDPIAYRCGYSDWMDGEYSDMVWEFENMEDGDTTERFGFTVEFVADEEEEEEEEEEYPVENARHNTVADTNTMYQIVPIDGKYHATVYAENGYIIAVGTFDTEEEAREFATK